MPGEQSRRDENSAHVFDHATFHDNNDIPPPTPPYRRHLSASQEAIGIRAMPPDYRSEYAASRDRLSERERATEGDSEYPEEKRPRTPAEKRDEPTHQANDSIDSQDDSQYATLIGGQRSQQSKGVHYPDLDGQGALSSINPITPRKAPIEGFQGFQAGRTYSGSGDNFGGRTSRASSVAGSDLDEEEDETYDWSDEEDLVDQEAKFEAEQLGNKPKKKGFSLFRVLRFFFSTLIGSIITAAALVAVPILLRILWYNKNKTDHRKYILDNVSAWLYWAAAQVLISWFLASIIDIIPHIVLFVVEVAWGNISEVMKGRFELYQTSKGYIKPAFYAATAWAGWSICFAMIFDLYDAHDHSLSRAQYTNRVYQVIVFLFFFTLVVCIEKLLIRSIAVSFHRSAFQERIDAVNTAVKVLDHLKDYQPKKRSGASTPLGFGFRTPGYKTPPHASWYDGSSNDPHYPHGHSGLNPQRNNPSHVEEGFAGDVEDEDAGYGKDKKKKRSSWFNSLNKGPKARSDSEHVEMQDSPTHAYPPSGSPQADGRGHFHKGSTGSGTRTPNRASMDASAHTTHVVTSAARALKAAVLHDARNMRQEEHAAEEIGMFSLNSPSEAKKLARNLYHAFRADKKRTHLIPSDFYPAYPTPDAAKEAFKVFDKDGNGDITRAEIKTKVLKVYKERRFLARSLRDVSQAVTTLDRIMFIGAMVILFFISLSIFGVSIGSSISSIYTVFIAASFIFKNAASNAFDSIMFLFVTHPFDTGDRCFIDNENLVVRKMGLFATVFTRADGSQTYYFNSMLSTKFIMNARRSGEMAENLELQVHWKTPLSKLEALANNINAWMHSDEKRWYRPDTSFALQRIEFQRNMEVTIGIPHNGNWQDWGLRLARKTAFHAACQYYCNQLGISWSGSPQPILFTDKNEPFLEEENEVIVDSQAPASPLPQDVPVTPVTPSRAHSHREHGRPLLGFIPPDPHKAGIRLRKTKGKKSAFNANAGD